ncbi:hypothetical protein J4E83_010467 [Alternaria metachromatica]|uniref:uncharacterized protein n=1 Tax=Alternaria metachromatica TaxID=283354 RepID=UPI0020C2678E|nr:uncharacterized protein J4E83_010467 [Alternaria metachromatica]KAI4605804.1 hypothetical protein J4E83_010467 [Alternaria metachromatica]
MSPPAAAAASPPFSHAASLAHYETKNSFELMVMAKLRCVSDAGENQEIIARLMAQDRENGTWPGKYEGPGAADATKTDGEAEEMNGEEVVVAPVGRVLVKEEMTPETGVGGAGRADQVPVAIVPGDRRARTATAGTTATSTRSRSPIIPLSQLAKEWDQDWGAPFAFPLAAPTAPTGSKPQAKAKPVTPTESVSSGSKSPATPASPRSQASRASLATPASSPPPIPASLKSNPYNLLMSDEQDDEEKEDDEEEEEEEESENEGLIIPLKMYTEKARAAAESTRAEVTYAATFSKDTVAAPAEQVENLPAPDSLASFEPSAEVMSVSGVGVLPEAPVVVRDFGAMVSPSSLRSSSPEEAAHKSDVAAFYNMPSPSPVQPATSTKTTPVKIFVSAPPPPPSSPPQPTHTVPPPPPPVPTKKTHHPRNEKRKQDQAVVSSNMWDVLAAEDTGDGDDTASAPVAVDTDDNNEVDSEDEAPQARQAQKKKNRRRGKKGGKKVQAMKQKVEQAVEVPVVVAPVLQRAVAVPVKMEKKMERSQALGVAAIIMVLVALLGARVLG